MDVHKFAVDQVPGVVDAPGFHVAGVAPGEHERSAIGGEHLADAREKLNLHTTFDDHGHVVAGM